MKRTILIFLFFVGTIEFAKAQQIQAQLFVQPLLSPYINDWQQDPNQTFIDVFSNLQNPRDVVLRVKAFHDRFGEIGSIESHPINLPQGMFQLRIDNTQFFDFQTGQLDQAFRSIGTQSGRLPGGNYQICIEIVDAFDPQLVFFNGCENGEIHEPQPPYLQYPFNEDTIFDPLAIFQWSPIDWTFSDVQYKITIVPRYQNQPCQEAISANPPNLQNQLLNQFSFAYPEWGLPFEANQNYCWCVQACDDMGNPIGENEGKSEVWGFTYSKLDSILVDSIPTQGIDTSLIRNPEIDSIPTITKNCNSITLNKTPAKAISAEIKINDLEKFPYPRALPLAGNAVDWDKVEWICTGCEGSPGIKSLIVRDEILDYSWSLESDLGNLESTIDTDKIKKLQEEIEKIKNEIQEIENEIQSKSDSLENFKIEKAPKDSLLKFRLKQKSKIDSTLKVYADSSSNISKYLENLKKKTKAYQDSVKANQDTIQKHLKYISKLQNYMSEQPSKAEIIRKKQVDKAKIAQEKAKLNLELHREKMSNEASRLNKIILNNDSLLDIASEKYYKIKQAVDSFSRGIGKKYGSLMKNPLYKKHFESNWEIQQKNISFLNKYASSKKKIELNEKFAEIQTLSESILDDSDTSIRKTKLPILAKKISDYKNELSKICGKSSACLSDLESLKDGFETYNYDFKTLEATGFILPKGMLATIKSMQGKSSKLNSDLRKAEKEIKIADSKYQASLSAYAESLKALKNIEKKLETMFLSKNNLLIKESITYNNLVQKRKDSIEKNKEIWFANINKKRKINWDLTQNISRLRDSLTLFFNEKTDFENSFDLLKTEIKDLEEEKKRLEKAILDLKTLMKKLEEKIKLLEKEIEAKNKEKIEKKKELELKEKELASLISPVNKSIKGKLVYYIPPTIEDLIEKKGLTPDFEKLKKAVQEAEDSLAYFWSQKAQNQQLIFKSIQDLAKNLLEYQKISNELENLKPNLKPAEDAFASIKDEKRKEYDTKSKAFDKIMENAEANRRESKTEADEFEAKDKKEKAELKKIRDKISLKISEKEAAKIEMQTALGQRSYQQGILDNNNRSISNLQNEIEKYYANWEKLKFDLARKEVEITQAQANQNFEKLAGLKSEASKIKSKITQIEGLMKSAETKLKSLKTGIESKQKALNTSELTLKEKESIFKTKTNEYNDLMNEFKKLNESYNNYDIGTKAWRYAEKKAEKLKADAEIEKEKYLIKTEDNLLEDESVSAEKANLDEIKAQIESLEAKEKGLRKSINENISTKTKLETRTQKDSTYFHKKLKLAEQNLYEFVLKEFDNAEFEVKLKLTVKDAQIDGFRSGDGTKEIKETINYKLRIPSYEQKNKLDPSKPPSKDKKGICQPNVPMDKLPDGPEKDGDLTNPKQEPRTICLLYKNGKPLWKEWPVFPTEASKMLIQSDVVVIENKFKTESDLIKPWNCISSVPICQSTPPTGGGSIRDLGTFDFESPQIHLKSPFLNCMFWDLPVPEKDFDPKFDVISSFKHNIINDGKREQKGKFEIKRAILIEVTDSLIGVPNGKDSLVARLVIGNHKGLKGDELIFKVKQISGEATGFGFGGSLEKTLATDEDGYVKIPFDFGNDFGEYEVEVSWKKGSDKKTISIKVPVYFKWLKLGNNPPEFVWKKAKSLVEKGKTFSSDELKDLIANFPDPSDEDAGEKIVSKSKIITGMTNVEHNFVNEKIVNYSCKDSKVKIVDKKPKTAFIGLAESDFELEESDDKKEKRILFEANLEEKYKAIAREFSIEKEYNTAQIKKFKIGISSAPFVIILDEPAARGEAINGTGILAPEMEMNDGILKVLKDKSLKFYINNIEFPETSEDVPMALSGSVSWKAKKPIEKEIKGFKISMDSLVIQANLGAGIGGKISKEKLIKKPISYYAEIDPDGNFYGEVKNLPEFEIKEFKILAGASAILDFSNTRSADVLGPDKKYMGLVINKGALQFPRNFATADLKKPTTIEVKHFYFKPDGIYGDISISSSVKMAYAGYELEATKISLSIEKNIPTDGEIIGNLKMPSPMDGEIKTTIRKAGNDWTAISEGKKPIYIARLDAKFNVEEASISWNSKKEIGTFEMLNASLVHPKLDSITVNEFKISSDGDITFDKKMTQSIQFVKGFNLDLSRFKFVKAGEEYGMAVEGKLGFQGITELKAGVSVAPGPVVGVEFKGGKIEFEKGPVSFLGELSLHDNEFQGNFDIGVKSFGKGKKSKGIKGLLIIGNQEKMNYWYAELEIPLAIPIPQAGLRINSLGGGLGYHYFPPFAGEEGSPNADVDFAFKLSTGISDVSGKAFDSKLEMLLAGDEFKVGGKIWFLEKETSLFGNAAMTLNLSNPELKGYVGARIKLNDPDGKILSFDGKINFEYSKSNPFIQSEYLEGNVFQLVQGKGNITVKPDYLDLNGKIFYKDSYTKGWLSASWDLGAEAKVIYKNPVQTLSASAKLWGEITADFKDYNLLSTKLEVSGTLLATPSKINIAAKVPNPWSYIPGMTDTIDLGYDKFY